MSDSVPILVDHLFRRASGRVVARLARRFGPRYLELAEDSVQEALVRALGLWPYRGVPDNPEAWIYRVARNAMIDAVRREIRFQDLAPLLVDDVIADRGPSDADDALLSMMLLCCHPAIAPDAQVALTLRVVAGFSVPEIARAFLANEATVSQKLSRARRKIRDHPAAFETLENADFDQRIDAVAAALYLMFSEGYALSSGDTHISRYLCLEAIRLTTLLVSTISVDRPDVDALLALMLLHGSRLPARLGDDGEIRRLQEQDRTKWDTSMIREGIETLNYSARGTELTAYHLQAGVAAIHSQAANYDLTDWPAILDHYDALTEISSSPVTALNRCVAVAMVQGPEAGLRELERLGASGALEDYALFHATAGQFAEQVGDSEQAQARFLRARELASTSPEQRFLDRKIEAQAGV